MDFGDELPCGGYEQQDQKIQRNLQNLSLQSEGLSTQNNGNGNCGGCQCDCQCQHEKVEKKVEQEIKPPKKQIKCKKCKEHNAVLVHKNQEICKECLMKNIQYKTRLTLENKIKVNSKSKLLICFSGGLNSICLVNIIKNIKKRYQKNPLFGHVQCIHVKQQSQLPENYVKTFQEFSEMKLNVVPIQQCYTPPSNFQTLVNLFNLMPPNSNSSDLLTLLLHTTLLSFANTHNFTHIMLASNGEVLASEMFKYFVKGIGGNVPQLYQQPPPTNKFSYPLRQHLQKQLQYYFYEHKLSAISLLAGHDDLSNLCHREVDGLLENFISTLQDRYSHTAPAIVRTGQKLDSAFEGQHFCQWCKNQHNNIDVPLCQKCVRLNQSMKNPKIVELLPQWMKL